MKVIDKIAWLEIQNGKILSTLSKGKDTLYFPGGKREEGESDEQTLIREIKEELTVDIQTESIKYYGTFGAQAHGKEEGVIVKMTCYMAIYKGSIQPSSEIEKVVWITYEDIDKVSPVDKIILKDLKEKGLI